MINKADKNITDVLSQIKDGATIMIGGFGTAGQPAELIDGLINLGVKDLVIINNNADLITSCSFYNYSIPFFIIIIVINFE